MIIIQDNTTAWTIFIGYLHPKMPAKTEMAINYMHFKIIKFRTHFLLFTLLFQTDLNDLRALYDEELAVARDAIGNLRTSFK